MRMLKESEHENLLLAKQNHERLIALVNTPELDKFLRAVHLEAVHQVERWGTADDRAKRPADWFWLVGYLAGKALHACLGGDTDKAQHHCVSTAAALYNWHCAIKGTDVRMCPWRSDVAAMLDKQFGNLDTDEWLLQDTRSHVGNDMVFWSSGGGYTTNINEAKRFTKEAAYGQHRCRETDLPWPLYYIAEKARPAVDFQYVNHAEATTPPAVPK